MAATPDTLRIGETITVRGTPLNSDGTSPGELINVTWQPTGPGVSVAQDSGDPYVAYVTGLQSTAAGVPEVVAVEGQDIYSSAHQGSVDVTVLRASRFKFSVGQVLLEPDPTLGNVVPLVINAYPWDVRDDPISGDIYPVDLGSPSTGVHDILWTSQNGSVLFGGPFWGSPPGTATLADQIKGVEIWPDITDGTLEPTTDVITVTAKNSQDEVITGTISVVIRRVATIPVEQVVD